MLSLVRQRTSCSNPSSFVFSRKVSFQTVNAVINALTSQAASSLPAASTSSLHGLRLAIKDNICTKNLPTTCSSKILENFKSPFDATVVSLLTANGAEIVGKANCDEFGMGSLNIHSAHGPVVNPFGVKVASGEVVERRSAGGSSGGSAAAVAANLCDAALGTDTGGSVRLPASYCGVVGLKPSYGIISRWGVVSFADSLDCVGVLARDVRTVRRVHDILAVYDSRDPTAAPSGVREKASQLLTSHFEHVQGDSLNGLRVGVPQEYFPTELQQSVVTPVRRILEQLRARGATLVPVSLPSTPYALSAYYVISSAEASSNLARYDGIEYGTRVEPPPGADLVKTANVYAHTRSLGFGKEVQRRMLLGTYALSADAFENYFLQAQRVRKLIKADFDRVFCVPNALASSPSAPADGVHVLLHPSAIETAPKLRGPDDATDAQSSTLDAYLQDVMTVPASLAGLPAMSVPGGQGADGWPIGVSVVGQWGCDELVMRVGEVIESCREDA
ncbi:amidase signature enzyme [Lentinus tigrinus ALCF2SS1-7]|uniref:Glutamyl-tRNA(Gln) amidotransferase subunit A, mitochondrial n=1 Tax=Lentinus tigrinus ALCF2SS1-6 TaxID=1328759 RepID=A0A5C2SL47_9APHY|nr:amidase signature enzyme [Lentinus tigrinus ALCF2SS1-6]RPD76704.1 amidase signature enzyme [Lentinus tigrinus ALCF2SS1-7]